MMAGRVAYGERYWQTPLMQTAPLGPQDVKFGSVPCVHMALGCVGVPTTLQPSAVHGLLSLQRVAIPELQAPCTQTSLAEHGFDAVGHGVPSATLACTQPLSRTHVEAVQGLCRRSSADRRERRCCSGTSRRRCTCCRRCTPGRWCRCSGTGRTATRDVAEAVGIA